MLGALVIVFREALEAGLIVGVVLAATRGVPFRGRWVAAGVGGGMLGACLLGLGAGKIASLFGGSGQELFNALILGIAVGMLAWHNAWMASHGREMAQDARTLGADVARGSRSLTAVATVVGIAVLREGAEVVVFLYGILAAEGGTKLEIVMGSAAGLLGGAAISLVLYKGLLVIPIRHFFSVTTMMITLLSAGLACQAVSFLQQGGYSVLWSTPLWNSSGLISEGSWSGKTLHALVGYTDQPTGMQMVVYASTLVFVFILATWSKRMARA